MHVEQSVILGALMLGLVILAWRSSMGAVERARLAGRRACRQADVQFLDDSMVCRRLRLRRPPGEFPELERLYLFEFATRGDRRYRGSVLVRGRRPPRVEMEAFEPIEEIVGRQPRDS